MAATKLVPRMNCAGRTDHGLNIIGLAILMRVGAAHQRAVEVGQIDLPLGGGASSKWPRRAATTIFFGVVGIPFAGMGRVLALVSGTGARLGFKYWQAASSLVCGAWRRANSSGSACRSWRPASAVSACVVRAAISAASLTCNASAPS